MTYNAKFDKSRSRRGIVGGTNKETPEEAARFQRDEYVRQFLTISIQEFVEEVKKNPEILKLNCEGAHIRNRFNTRKADYENFIRNENKPAFDRTLRVVRKSA